MASFSLINKVALVSGASRGLGKAVALALLSDGAQVIAVGRSAESLDRLADAVAVDVPFDPCLDATAAIVRAKDLAVEILRRVGGAA